jgi:signal transduction histidine kinase
MRRKALLNQLNSETLQNRDKILLFMRWGIIISILSLWWFSGGNAVGIALILVLSSTTLIRMQFTDSIVLVLIEELACYFIVAYWPGALYALLMPSVESGLSGNPLLFLPVLFILIYKGENNTVFILILALMSFAIGYILRAWTARETIYRLAADSERKQRYEVESLKNELLAANREVARLAETAERNRIAQQLHDNVGHELAGALIALQTYKKLVENGDGRAAEMLENVLRRVEDSSVKLRETVYRLRPETESGAARLQKICDGFTLCPLRYTVAGNPDIVPGTVWILLEPCLKEALTNMMKYSSATQAAVKIDITPFIVRMNVKDNGRGAQVIKTGLGLTGIRERIRAAGGTVSVDGSDGFMITCILPLRVENQEG